jgi:cell division protein FtsW (lipid II flippase)
LNAVFGGFLGLSVVLIFVGAIMFFFNKPKLRIILHLCWMLFTLITFVGLAISIFLYVFNLCGFSFCDYFGYRVFRWDDPAYSPSKNPEWENLNNKVLKLTGTSEELAIACFI